jgi:DNA-binding transcriptional regulator YdaS (Cro superfamily)
MSMIDQLGGPTAVARMVGCRVPSVIEWRKRGIPPERCPFIEHATQATVTVETLRPDVHWARIPDPAWPHPAGRPVIDIARPQVAAKAGVN